MSFSTEVKNELIGLELEYPCCLKSMAYGLMLFGRSFSLSNISMMTDYIENAEKYKEIVEKATDTSVELSQTPSGKHIVSVISKQDREKIFHAMNLTGMERYTRINRGILTNEGDDENNCCFSAFIRGAFLSCGMICDPNKMYTLEFVIPSNKLSEDLLALFNEIGIQSKITVRRGVRVLYIKDSTNIEDTLTLMGATLSSLELMNIKILKDVRNRVNRQTNFETANISRTIDASFKQIEELEYFDRKVGLDTLPEELYKIALLRMENPEMSLREMGEMLTPKITRSSVNHRLSKLMQIVKEFKEQEQK